MSLLFFLLYNIQNNLSACLNNSNFAYMKYLITLLVTLGFGILYCILGLVGSLFVDVAWYSPLSVLTGILAIIFTCAIFITSLGIYTEIKQK